MRTERIGVLCRWICQQIEGVGEDRQDGAERGLCSSGRAREIENEGSAKGAAEAA